MLSCLEFYCFPFEWLATVLAFQEGGKSRSLRGWGVTLLHNEAGLGHMATGQHMPRDLVGAGVM